MPALSKTYNGSSRSWRWFRYLISRYKIILFRDREIGDDSRTKWFLPDSTCHSHIMSNDLVWSLGLVERNLDGMCFQRKFWLGCEYLTNFLISHADFLTDSIFPPDRIPVFVSTYTVNKIDGSLISTFTICCKFGFTKNCPSSHRRRFTLIKLRNFRNISTTLSSQ